VTEVVRSGDQNHHQPLDSAQWRLRKITFKLKP